jgi:hypothetical protein
MGAPGTPTTLSWNAADWDGTGTCGSQGTYQVCVNKNGSCDALNNTAVSGTQTSVSANLTEGYHTWGVRAVNNCLSGGAWPTAWGFTLACDTPGKPTITSPANNQRYCVENNNVGLFWDAADWNGSGTCGTANKYGLCVSKDGGACDVVQTTEIPAANTSYDLHSVAGTLGLGHYTWTMGAYNNCGKYSGDATARAFDVICGTPDAPSLVSPNSGVTLQNTSYVDLDWSAPASWGGSDSCGSAKEYLVCVSSDGGATCNIASTVVQAPATNKQVTISTTGTFYWKVTAINSCGGQATSAIRSFVASQLPKTCSVTVAKDIGTTQESVTVTVTGNTYSSYGDTIRLWLEKYDATQYPTPAEITPGVTQLLSGGRYYYHLDSADCTSTGTCTKTINLKIPNPGKYYLHCDVPTDPNNCSGNPFCSFNYGSINPTPPLSAQINCGGWVTCSNADTAYYCSEPTNCQGCGEPGTCGNCDTSQTGAPGNVSLAAPIGSVASPVVIGSGTTQLKWSASNSPLTDHYRYQVVNLSTGVTVYGSGTGVTVDIGTSQVSHNVGVGTSGQTFKWGVAAVNNTCQSLGVGQTYMSGWSYGYYCYNAENCSLACGQARDCPGQSNCPTTSAAVPNLVTSNSPASIDALNPTVINDTNTVTLRWTANGAGSNTDGYNWRVQPLGINTSGVVSGLTTNSANFAGSYAINYQWDVRGRNQTCNGIGVGTTYGPWSTSRYFRFNRTSGVGSSDTPSLYSGVTITNSANSVVNGEVLDVGSSANHICDLTRFPDRQTVRFKVKAFDLDGVSEIDQVYLRLGSNNSVSLTGLASGGSVKTINGSGWSWENGGVGAIASVSNGYLYASFPVVIDRNLFAAGTYDIGVRVIDKYGGDTGWVNIGRRLKIWNCQVAVSGTFFDGTPDVLCQEGGPSVGFDDPAPPEMMFTSLAHQGVSPAGTVAATVDRVNSSHQATLEWGRSYDPVFNSDLDASGRVSRTIDVGVGTTKCPLSDRITLNSTNLNPYSNSPTLQLDYSAVKNQEAWYQIAGGGMMGANTIRDDVPVTCANDASCQAAMTVSNGANDNGLIVGGEVRNDSGCGSSCQVGKPKDTWVQKNLTDDRYNYDYFYNEYKVKLGVGEINLRNKNSSDIGQTGVVFVGGAFTINQNRILPPGQFSMVIVRGNVVVSQNVTRWDGIVLTDGSFSTEKGSNTQLEIQGIILANGGVSLNRGYAIKSLNNTNPGVKVVYRPEMIFSMPGNLMGSFGKWRETGE